VNPAYIVLAACIALLVGGFVFLFLRKRKLPDGPVPKKWHRILEKRVRYYRELPPERQKVFGKRVQGFLEDVTVNGAKTKVSLTDKLLVAASAEIPLFGFNQWRYPNLDEVILVPGNFSLDWDPENPDANVLGVVGNRELNRTMVLSKGALRKGFGRHTEHNVGIHEFTHLLDGSDGATDGSPDLYMEDGLVGPWMRTISRELAKIRSGDSDLDDYAGTNEAEFFAVASEYFFNRPDELAADHPKLFAMLERIFHQDPTADSPVVAFEEDELPPPEG